MEPTCQSDGRPVVFVSVKSPVPPTTGSRVRIKNLVEAAAQLDRPHLVIIGELPGDERAALDAWGVADVTVCPTRRCARPSFATIRWILGRGPIDALRRIDAHDVMGVLERVVRATTPRAVWVGGAWAQALLPSIVDPLLIVDVAGLESELCRGEISSAFRRPSRIALRRAIRAAVGRRARIHAERALWRRAAIVTPVSLADRDLVNRAAPSCRTVILPNGVEPSVAVEPVRSKRLAFIGNLHYGPNAEAARWLLDEIVPEIRRIHSDVAVDLVGLCPDALRQEFEACPGTRCHGYVNELSSILRLCEVVVAPLRSGAGTKLKVLDGLASGLPVVSTSVGVEGIDGIVDRRHARIADSARTFASCVVDLLNDPGAGRVMAGEARRLMQQCHTWADVRNSFADLVTTMEGAR